MRKHQQLLSGVAAAALTLAAGATSAAEQPVATAPAENDRVATEVATVVVTAERRQESAQRTPVSVTAIGGDEIQKAYVHNLADLTRAAPNFTIEGVGATSRSSAVIYSRGIGFSSIDGVEPPVGISIDDQQRVDPAFRLGLGVDLGIGAAHEPVD